MARNTMVNIYIFWLNFMKREMSEISSISIRQDSNLWGILS